MQPYRWYRSCTSRVDRASTNSISEARPQDRINDNVWEDMHITMYQLTDPLSFNPLIPKYTRRARGDSRTAKRDRSRSTSRSDRKHQFMPFMTYFVLFWVLWFKYAQCAHVMFKIASLDLHTSESRGPSSRPGSTRSMTSPLPLWISSSYKFLSFQQLHKKQHS